MHSTYSKIKLFIYLFEASVVLDWSAGMFVFGWSMVSYHYSNTLQLYNLFATVVALPTELPLGHTQLHRRIPTPILLKSY